ncbi:MAG: ORF6N domain-containing protein [Parabacteroides distasonis]|nr:ORF6N domain-containing protein [Parabacteroides distasonis]
MELQAIQNKIHEIRGLKVMLDFDLAEMYGTETKYLKRSVKNNIKRFPHEFMFELTKEEWDLLRCKISTLKTKRGQYPKYLPFVFTELGVAMLSSVLNSNIAIEINIYIMRAFVAIRQLTTNPPQNEFYKLQQEVKELKAYIEEAFTDYNDINEDTRTQLELINLSLAELQAKRTENQSRPRIGYVK